MRVAFDVGGTFTDVIVSYGAGRVRTAKVLSRLDRVGGDLAAIIEEHDGEESVVGFVHASTVCSNALIERTTPDVALVTTKGFRDVLEMMGQRGPTVRHNDWERVAPLVPRDRRLELDERMLTDGTVDRALDPDEVARLVAEVRSREIPVVAVCLINSFVNPAHERRVRDVFAASAPRIAVSISSEVHPEIKEYERTSTTVINASLLPVVNDYLDRLQSHLDRFSTTMRIMQSNGGTVSARIARERPMTMVESGPAAGVLAAATTARALGIDLALSFDMGGTTAKACLIEGGLPLEKSGSEIGASTEAVRQRSQGHALRVPSLDIVEVGAGGGSIAWVDASGALRVGPRSAGAEPGPACYGRGGLDPTVTDANVALGYMSPEAIAGNALRIDREAALHAIDRHVAGPLGLDVLDAAHGIVEVADATMMRALRAVSTERGRDIRGMTLIAFGGSGPVHAGLLCEAVGIDRIVVPPLPGVFSALGLLLAGDRVDYVHSVERPLADVRPEAVVGVWASMSSAARLDLDSADLSYSASVDLRYGLRAAEINVPVDVDGFDPTACERTFKQAHHREFGFEGEGELHVANLRLRVSTNGEEVRLGDLGGPGRATSIAASDDRLVYFGRGHGGQIRTPILRREEMGRSMEGPAIIEEETTTIVVRPGWSAVLDDRWNLLLTRS